jgi:2-methylcitrate dehydratase PrpD
MSRFAATQAIVDFVQRYRLSDESGVAVEKGKILLLDYLGVAFAGARSGEGKTREIASLFASSDGRASVIGTAQKASASNAALVNGFSGHLLEYDDSSLRPVGHPSATILPALLALAEERGSDGDVALESYLVGLEVHARLGQAQSGNWSQSNTWLPIGHIGLVGAAVAAAHLISLDEVSTMNCIGLAAHFAGQLNVSSASMAKPLGAGHSARCAIQAAQLAEIGVSGPTDVIECVGGFADTFLDGAEGLEAALLGLDGPSHLEEIGIAIKQYPSCYGTHWSIDAMRELMQMHNLSGDQIRSVLLVYPTDSAFLDDPDPSDVEAARFSLQFGLAACIVDGSPTLESYGDSRLEGNEMKAALKRVRALPHPAATDAPQKWAHMLTIVAESGREYVHSVKRPRGHPRNPLSREEVAAKFFGNTAVLGRGIGELVVSEVSVLDRGGDIGRCVAPLSRGDVEDERESHR